jgi:formate dehydrogenase subunit gamma
VGPRRYRLDARRRPREGVPAVGRFSAGQKAVFWSMALLVPVFFLAGIVIWDVYF